MAPGLIKTLLGQGAMHKTLSFEDFSLGTMAEAEETLSPTKESPIMQMATSPTAPATPSSGGGSAANSGSFSPSGARGWASVFNPGRNNNPMARSPGARYYDTVDKPADDGRTVWEEVIKAKRLETLRDLSAKMGPRGVINAADLRDKLGGGADVAQLVAAADKDGDGRVDFADLSELIRNS